MRHICGFAVYLNVFVAEIWKKVLHSLEKNIYEWNEIYVDIEVSRDAEVDKNHTVFVQGHANKFICAGCKRDKRMSNLSKNIGHHLQCFLHKSSTENVSRHNNQLIGAVTTIAQ